MGIFSDIFSVKSVDNIVNAVIDTGDVLVYTDEERAKAEQLKIDTKLKMLPLFEPFKIAQRYIAFAFTFTFIFSFFIGVSLLFIDDNLLKKFLDLVSVYQLGWIMLSIIAFYFGSTLIPSRKGK